MILPRYPKCRILFVIDDMGVGGAQKQIAEVANRLDANRFEADIVCIERGGAMLERLRGSGQVFILGARRLYDGAGLAALSRLSRIIRRGRYDVVEAYLPAAHLFCALALAGRRRPALIAARRQMASLDPAWMAAAAPLLNRATRFSIANSRAVRDSVVSRYGLRPARVAVVPNIVETAFPLPDRNAARERFGLSREEFAVAAAGSFHPVKDYPTIIRAFAHLRRTGLPSVLLAAGDGKGREAAARCARSLGVHQQVRLLGALDDVRPVLAAADVFVHASRSEGLPNAVLEAMAAGLPVVASDIPGSREALGADCGAYFAPGDWRGCHAALERMALDPEAAAAAGRAAGLRVRRVYSDALVRRRERLYVKLSEVTNVNSR